jgi:hypothetical protein
MPGPAYVTTNLRPDEVPDANWPSATIIRKKRCIPGEADRRWGISDHEIKGEIRK